MTTPERPRIAVLCASADDRPPRVDELAAGADLVYCDAAGLRSAIAEADALFVWDFFSGALEQAWDAAGTLRWVHVAAAGVDSLLFPGLVASPVVVTNARGIFDRSIAEYALTAVLAVAKDLRNTYALQARHEWRHRETEEVRGTRALVVGTGAIGREIARLFRAVGVEVAGVGRTARDDDPDFGRIVASEELAEHVSWADHVIAVAPLTEQTRGMFDARVFAAMSERTHFVNVGRGELVVESDLVEALRRGTVHHATLDVFETEPLDTASALWDLPNVTISAHMSGDTNGWRTRLAEQFVANAHRWLAGQPLMNVVDKHSGFSAARSQPDQQQGAPGDPP